MTTRLVFQSLAGDLTVDLAAKLDSAAIVAACRLLLPGWSQQTVHSAAPVDIAIDATPEGYEIAARSWPGGVAVAGDVNNLANALGGLLIDALLARHPATRSKRSPRHAR